MFLIGFLFLLDDGFEWSQMKGEWDLYGEIHFNLFSLIGVLFIPEIEL